MSPRSASGVRSSSRMRDYRRDRKRNSRRAANQTAIANGETHFGHVPRINAVRDRETSQGFSAINSIPLGAPHASPAHSAQHVPRYEAKPAINIPTAGPVTTGPMNVASASLTVPQALQAHSAQFGQTAFSNKHSLKPAMTLKPAATSLPAHRTASQAARAYGYGIDTQKESLSMKLNQPSDIDGPPFHVTPSRGARRTVPCQGCILSAVSGSSSGACHDASSGPRCAQCAPESICQPTAPHVIPVALRLVAAIEAKAEQREINDLRAAVRVLLSIPDAEFYATVAQAAALASSGGFGDVALTMAAVTELHGRREKLFEDLKEIIENA
ncbi:hypothetical protein F4861DRAFT_535687 [Xylaria intraflava]|nr:hypothetical protein F4861DRAFT_535687 [Xylaria intraflava]